VAGALGEGVALGVGAAEDGAAELTVGLGRRTGVGVGVGVGVEEGVRLALGLALGDAGAEIVAGGAGTPVGVLAARIT